MTRVAIVAFRYDRFDDVLPVEFRDEQQLAGQRAASALSSTFDVVATFDVRSMDDAIATQERVRALHPDVAVVVPSTAVPPEWVNTALPAEIVTVIWDGGRGEPLPRNADQVQAHRDTASVGAIMAGGALARSGRRFVTVSASVSGSAVRVLEAVQMAAGAAALTKLRVLRIGQPIPGYTTIPAETDADEYQSVGLQIIDVNLEDFVERCRRATADSNDATSRSAAVEASVGELCTEHAPHAVAINCHGALLNDCRVGVVGCAAATACNASGVPTACTADVPTAFALFAASTVAGTALYCEPYVVDDSAGAVLLANCGIGQPAMASTGTWREIPSQNYPGVGGRGRSIAMAVRPGPSTYIAVRMRAARWTLIAIEGEVLDKQLPQFGGAHGYFSPNALTPRQMIEALADHGVVHHGALAPGHSGERLRQLGRIAPFDVIRI